MLVDKNTTRVVSETVDFTHVMSEGGVLWEANTVPGSTKLIGGNLQAGFYGELPTSEFITGDELAAKIGLTAGISQYSNEPWLKFSYLGKIEFISKKSIRHSISWGDLNTFNLVYGNKKIDIDGNMYKIRLMKGKTEGKQNDRTQYRGVINQNSEWNKLMLPIHYNAPDRWQYSDNVNSPTENWNIGYTDRDLLTHSDYGEGSYTWCQEYGELYNTRVYRGNYGVSYSESQNYSSGYSGFGWRPVLELVD